jgi:hypothetical protein
MLRHLHFTAINVQTREVVAMDGFREILTKTGMGTECAERLLSRRAICRLLSAVFKYWRL